MKNKFQLRKKNAHQSNNFASTKKVSVVKQNFFVKSGYAGSNPASENSEWRNK
ncbi:hypothetical protein AB4Y90_08025 [Chryseobacterium sp. 2TAF14]|uniref:hypothetical protein n=1 Tax=Chryseobacterium sp. 2TAF14 TaxID=3233007 RepID=UPI003F8F51CA